MEGGDKMRGNSKFAILVFCMLFGFLFPWFGDTMAAPIPRANGEILQ